MASKIHVTLAKNAMENADKLKKLVNKIVKIADMTDINQKRLERYGILSGLIDDEKIGLLKDIEGVVSVDADRKRYATEEPSKKAAF